MKLRDYRFAVEVVTARFPGNGKHRQAAAQAWIRRRTEEIRAESGTLVDSALLARAEWLKEFCERLSQ